MSILNAIRSIGETDKVVTVPDEAVKYFVAYLADMKVKVSKITPCYISSRPCSDIYFTCRLSDVDLVEDHLNLIQRAYNY